MSEFLTITKNKNFWHFFVYNHWIRLEWNTKKYLWIFGKSSAFSKTLIVSVDKKLLDCSPGAKKQFSENSSRKSCSNFPIGLNFALSKSRHASIFPATQHWLITGCKRRERDFLLRHCLSQKQKKKFFCPRNMRLPRWH